MRESDESEMPMVMRIPIMHPIFRPTELHHSTIPIVLRITLVMDRMGALGGERASICSPNTGHPTGPGDALTIGIG